MNKRTLLLVIIGLVFILFPGRVQAQQSYFFGGLTYTKPMSNLDWIKTGGMGYEAGYRYFLQDGKYSIGLDYSYSVLREYAPTETIPTPGGAITTDYFKYMYATNLVVNFQYYFLEGSNPEFFPYAGLGVGAQIQRYRLYYNIYQENDNGVGALLRPEVGFLYKPESFRSAGIKLSATWNLATGRSSDFEVQNYSAFTIHASIMLLGY